MKKLEVLPENLEKMFDQILQDIDVCDRPKAFKILQWLAFSARPVRVKEAMEVFAIELSDDPPRYDPDGKPFGLQDLMSICSTLVKTDTTPVQDIKEEAYYTSHLVNFVDTETIGFAHASVKDYLVSRHVGIDKSPFYAMEAISANNAMAQTCLAYLLRSTFASGYCDRDATQARLRDQPLLHYAANLWPFHVNAVGESLDERTWRLIEQFFATKDWAGGGNFGSWVAALVPDIQSRTTKTQPLYYAASYGMTVVVRRLLDSSPNIVIDARGGRLESTALHVACYRQHLDVVKLLLEAGANAMSINGAGESCIFWPTVRNNVKLQRILKSYGATFSQHDVR